MTPSQCRAARALVSISQDDLAKAASIAEATIAAFELDQRLPYARTLTAIRGALESAGVIFLAENGNGPGVALRKEL